LKIKYFILVISILVVCCCLTYSQNEIQSWQAKVDEVTTKHPEQLTTDDLNFLQTVVKINPKIFGEALQKVVMNRKEKAGQVLKFIIHGKASRRKLKVSR